MFEKYDLLYKSAELGIVVEFRAVHLHIEKLLILGFRVIHPYLYERFLALYFVLEAVSLAQQTKQAT